MTSVRPGSRYDVLLQGDPFCDLTFAFANRDELPPVGQEVFADDFAVNPGGVFNIASTLTSLGAKVGLAACLGNDIFSRFIAERMEECGLSLDLTTWVDEPRPIITAGISFPHDRLFISYTAPPNDQYRRARITSDDLDRYRPRVLFTYGEVGLDVMEAAQARGVLVYVDTFWSTDHLHSTYLRRMLEHVDIFSPNLPEALELTQTVDAEVALQMLSGWCRCAVIKCGARGCLAWRGGERFAMPALSVQSRETTGAGDNFNAGLIYGLLHGYPLERCLRAANIVGGLSTLKLGGSGIDVSAQDVEQWLEQHLGGAGPLPEAGWG